MSELFTHTSASSPEYLPLLRVAVIIPERNIILSPNPQRVELFSDVIEQSKPLSKEKRATAIGQRVTRYALPAMSAHLDLASAKKHENDCWIGGYCVRPSSGSHIDTSHNIYVSEFAISETVELLQDDPDHFDDIDHAFLMRALSSYIKKS